MQIDSQIERERNLYYSTEDTADFESNTNTAEQSTNHTPNRIQLNQTYQQESESEEGSYHTLEYSGSSGRQASDERSSGDSQQERPPSYLLIDEAYLPRNLQKEFETTKNTEEYLRQELQEPYNNLVKSFGGSAPLSRTSSAKTDSTETQEQQLNIFAEKNNLSEQTRKLYWEQLKQKGNKEKYKEIKNSVKNIQKIRGVVLEEVKEEELSSDSFINEIDQASGGTFKQGILNISLIKQQIHETQKELNERKKTRETRLKGIMDFGDWNFEYEPEDDEILLVDDRNESSDYTDYGIDNEIIKKHEKLMKENDKLFAVRGKDGVVLQSKNRDAEINIVVEEGLPYYEIKGIALLNAIKVNGLPFYRREDGSANWFTLIRDQENFKEEDGRVAVPLDLFTEEGFEKKTTNDLLKIRLKNLEKEYEKISKTPLRSLTEEQKKISDEYQQMNIKKMQKELEKQQAQFKYNQEQWNRKTEKQGWLESWLGDPLKRETGWGDPEFMTTLKLFGKEEESEIEKVTKLLKEKAADKEQDFMNMMIQMAKTGENKTAEYPLYDEEDNPIEWLTEFWGVCVANKVNDARKLEILMVALTGEAKKWYLRNKHRITKFGDLKRGTKGSFVKEFLERFAGLPQQYQWGQQLSELRQLPGESTIKFNAKWRDLSTRADPMGRGYEPGKIKDYVNALLPELRFHVRVRGPKTIKEAMEAARNAEIAYGETGVKVNVARKQVVQPEVDERITRIEALLTQQYTNKNIRCNLCNQLGHKAENCRTRTMNQERKRQGVCFNCGKEGHMRRDCREPQKKTTCTYCGRTGHKIENCWKKQGRTGNNNNQQRQPFNNQNVIRQERRIVNGKPVRVYTVEEDRELDTNEKLTMTIEQLNKNLEKNLKL